MDFAFGDEQEELRRYVAQWLAERVGMAEVRRISELDEGSDPGHWKEMAEMGWLGLGIPESHGGSGFGFMEQAVLLEEFGRSLLPSPYFSTQILAATALLETVGTRGDSEVDGGPAERWLARMAAGGVTATVTVSDSKQAEIEVQAIAADRPGAALLDGSARFVIDGHTADLLIVAAHEGSHISLFAVETGADGVSTVLTPSLDPTRKQADVVVSNVSVSSEDRIGAPGDGDRILKSVRRRASVALALEQVGGAQRCLDMATDYAKNRKQFGRPIGSFQAIKHLCADMFVQVESARAAAYYAAWAESEGVEEADVAVALAKSFCSEASFRCAADNIQIHGGIGFTSEHDAHLYFKRASASRLLFGSPDVHRRDMAESLGF